MAHTKAPASVKVVVIVPTTAEATKGSLGTPASVETWPPAVLNNAPPTMSNVAASAQVVVVSPSAPRNMVPAA